MKLFRALLVTTVVAVPALLSAASTYDAVYVHVPFEFVAAGQRFSPGDYRIQSNDSGLILIQGSGKAAATLSIPGAIAKPGAPTALKFSSDGAREHLVGIQVEGQATRTLSRPSEIKEKALLTSR